MGEHALGALLGDRLPSYFSLTRCPEVAVDNNNSCLFCWYCYLWVSLIIEFAFLRPLNTTTKTRCFTAWGWFLKEVKLSQIYQICHESFLKICSSHLLILDLFLFFSSSSSGPNRTGTATSSPASRCSSFWRRRTSWRTSWNTWPRPPFQTSCSGSSPAWKAPTLSRGF